MELGIIGLNHRTAPLTLRERFALPSSALPRALALLKSDPQIREAAILSTCNRTEIYVLVPGSEAGHAGSLDAVFQRLTDFLSHLSNLEVSSFDSCLYRRKGRQTVEHLIRVTAGLDSMVLGETEVTVQVKQAYQAAQEAGMVGPTFHRLFQKALHGAKELRSRTGLMQGRTSIGSVVAVLAQDLFGEDLSRCEVLLWGAGKAAEATVRHLTERGIGHLWVVSRTQARAQTLAALCKSEWLSWEQAFGHLEHVDIAVVCTQAPHYVIEAEELSAILERRGRWKRPLFVIDLAVPRNVDPAVAGQEGVRLYNIDDLKGITERTLARRQQDLGACQEMVEEQAERFMEWWNPDGKGAVRCGSEHTASSS